jgi:hypothetical protein
VYITLDVCFASVALAGNAAYGRLLWPAVTHLGLANTWQQLLSISITLSSSTALLLYWHFAPASYKQRREQLVMGYRLVRLANNYWTAYWSSATARIMLFAARIGGAPAQERSPTQGIVELVTKQLHMVPLTNLALVRVWRAQVYGLYRSRQALPLVCSTTRTALHDTFLPPGSSHCGTR